MRSINRTFSRLLVALTCIELYNRENERDYMNNQRQLNSSFIIAGFALGHGNQLAWPSVAAVVKVSN